MVTVAALYFDGHSARAYSVQLSLDGDVLRIQGEGIERAEPLAALQIGARVGRAPRTIEFADGARCEVRDHDGFDALLQSAAQHPGRLHRAEGNWRIVLASLVLIVAAGAAAFVWGLPLGAQLIARNMPPSLVRALSDRSMQMLDRHVLQPTKLAPERCVELQRAVERLRGADGMPLVERLEFRAGGKLGPNAFALPDGTVVLLDELVALADNDEQIVAVIGHELGHVVHRHGLRLIAQGSAVGVLAAWWFGDVSSILAAAPTLLMQAHYSRRFEAEADQYAATLMREHHIAPARLSEILGKLAARQPAADDGEAPFGGLLDSHPGLAERVRALDGERGGP